VNILKVALEHCYGIRQLKHSFDFTNHRTIPVYAPNGSMKTSLATTFSDLGKDQNSVDRIYPHRVTVRKIVDENDTPLSKDTILVLQPYLEAFGSGDKEKFCTLLVNPTLRGEFEALHREADRSKEALLKALKKQSGSKRDLAKEISVILTKRKRRSPTYLTTGSSMKR
jgi:hypothetical protein